MALILKAGSERFNALWLIFGANLAHHVTVWLRLTCALALTV